MYTTTTAMLTRDQLEALRTWAKHYGRTWKSSLRHAWFDGDYETFQYSATSAYLQQVRNTFGPSWLVRFVLPKDGGFCVFDRATDAAAAEQSGKVL